MFEYLVTSNTRRTLLKLLWLDGVSGTASDLSKKSGAAFAGVYRELRSMAESELATVEFRNGRKVYSSNRTHPMASLLLKLLKNETKKTKKASESGAMVRENLAYLGLPVSSNKVPPEDDVTVEELLVKGTSLAREDASVARALPIFVHYVKDELDFDTLKLESRKYDAKHLVGFFLDLESKFSNDQRLADHAQEFFDRRYKTDKNFFSNQTKYSMQSAEENTPELAKKWGWLMNMSLDTFENIYRKFESASVPSQ